MNKLGVVLALLCSPLVFHFVMFRSDEIVSYVVNVGGLWGAAQIVLPLFCFANNKMIKGTRFAAPVTVLAICVSLALLTQKLDGAGSFLPEFSAGQLHQYAAPKVVLVTGANSGVGLSMAIVMAQMGSTVVLGCRSTSRCKAARDSSLALKKNAVLLEAPLDLASFASIDAFAKEFKSKSVPCQLHPPCTATTCRHSPLAPHPSAFALSHYHSRRFSSRPDTTGSTC